MFEPMGVEKGIIKNSGTFFNSHNITKEIAFGQKSEIHEENSNDDRNRR